MKFAAWAVMLCSWLTQALAARHTLEAADGISYLNIAYSCLDGNWHALVNGYWSPGYPFLLTLWLKLFNPSPFREILALRMLTFVSLVVALITFEYFLSVFFTFPKKLTEGCADDIKESLPDEAIRIVGYCLFFWVTTFLTPPDLSQPDILVFILYLLASSLCMQLQSSNRDWPRCVLLGIVLGLAYLAKAVMFPLAFTFFAALIFRKDRWRFLPRLLLAVAIFAAVSAPLILALSKTKGRLTYGDAGAINYRHIIGMSGEIMPGTFPQIYSASMPRPAAAPHIQEYTRIINLGTYPPWADPSYDYKGEAQPFYFRRQLNRTHIVLRYYFDLYIVQLGGLVSGFLVLLLWGGTLAQYGKRLLRQVVLWFPAVAGLTLYSLIRVEGRFLAGFTIALFAACAAALRIGKTDLAQKLARSVAFAVSLLLLSQIGIKVNHEGQKLFANDRFPDWQVATTLHQMGVEAGERVSYMGETLIDHVWAHLARVTVAAEIPKEDIPTFWAADQAEKLQALEWLATTGAKVLVTRNVPSTAMSAGWRRIGDTDYYVLALPQKNTR